jgi:hypothetical protein
MPTYKVTDKNGKEIKEGDSITSFRGEAAKFNSVTRGVEYNGTAKVSVTWDSDGSNREYYAGVFNLNVVTLNEKTDEPIFITYEVTIKAPNEDSAPTGGDMFSAIAKLRQTYPSMNYSVSRK